MRSGSGAAGRWLYSLGEGVEQGLELGDGGGLVGLGGEPLLHGLLEPFDLAAGGGVVGAGVLLDHAEAAQLGLEAVAAARLPPESRVVNTMPLSVSVEAGIPCVATVLRNAASTIGPVTRWWAVTRRA